ncbi:ABC transporter ATP-binding protein [Salinibacterium sp. dk2585]|uniref:ABC transporter ATP-binding protein n=1 Tax=unclassified Salinibacterium TaxID=2632331 RepID=UPI0011C255AD|nr:MULTISPECIES: ABC transporter ATP-binding protein [unclassified Salinibacterium]QEE60800.1 ABC transporter ATP-binding protein [Salinibacterium sp. dk2585]TXK55872.1 ABC transporter ATP-binding protein [Salinibacterium sp. dk5596]
MKLELRGVTKRFGALVANDHIDLVVEAGEIHCLLGENGAGKSTLMNVLYGLYQADEGEILLDGAVQNFSGPGDAMAAGIGMVHQHFMLIPVFTVAENVMLGHEQTKGGVFLDLDGARAKVREISERFGFNIDPDAVVGDLPVGSQQRVEIIKALSREAKVLVLDEPTAVLTPQETDELMEIMRQLKESGTSIVFITHKLREVRAVADRITVIRLGKVVGTALPSESTTELASKMVGRSVDLSVDKAPPTLGDSTFEVTNLTVFDPNGNRVVDDLSFDIRQGEIVVIAGVQGNGQTELTEAILGLQKKTAGSIRLDGKELLGRNVKQVLDAGVGFVPEDRTEDGLVAEFTIAENAVLDRFDRPPFARGLSLALGEIRAFAERVVREYDVRTPTIDTYAGRLSGGNQQKVVLARELERDLRIFIASQPTRGLDVGSIEFVHEQIVRARDSGIPVLIVSTELDEVVELADRIMVMYRGRSVGIVEPTTPREVIGQMMAGIPA